MKTKPKTNWRGSQGPAAIKALRRHRGENREQFGKAMLSSASAVGKWERGDCRPLVACCVRLDELLADAQLSEAKG